MYVHKSPVKYEYCDNEKRDKQVLHLNIWSWRVTLILISGFMECYKTQWYMWRAFTWIPSLNQSVERCAQQSNELRAFSFKQWTPLITQVVCCCLMSVAIWHHSEQWPNISLLDERCSTSCRRETIWLCFHKSLQRHGVFISPLPQSPEGYRGSDSFILKLQLKHSRPEPVRLTCWKFNARC